MSRKSTSRKKTATNRTQRTRRNRQVVANLEYLRKHDRAGYRAMLGLLARLVASAQASLRQEAQATS